MTVKTTQNTWSKYESALQAINGVWIPGYEGQYAWSHMHKRVYTVKGWVKDELFTSLQTYNDYRGGKFNGRYWNLHSKTHFGKQRKIRMLESEILEALEKVTTVTIPESRDITGNVTPQSYFIPVDALHLHKLYWLSGLGEMYAFSRTTGELLVYDGTVPSRLRNIDKKDPIGPTTKWRVVKKSKQNLSPRGRLLSAPTTYYSLMDPNGRYEDYSAGDVVNMIGEQVTKEYFCPDVAAPSISTTVEVCKDEVYSDARDNVQFKYMTVFNDGVDECFNTFDNESEATDYATKKAIKGAKVYLYKLSTIFESKTEVITTKVQ